MDNCEMCSKWNFFIAASQLRNKEAEALDELKRKASYMEFMWSENDNVNPFETAFPVVDVDCYEDELEEALTLKWNKKHNKSLIISYERSTQGRNDKN